MTETPKVGVSVIIIKDNKVLVGKRINSHGSGTWHFPGGHVEEFESFKSCAKREIKEETNLDVELIDESPTVFTRDFFEKENKDYVTFYMRAKYVIGEVKNMEPDKCLGWEWVEWDKIPKPLFIPVKNLIKTGYNPFNVK